MSITVVKFPEEKSSQKVTLEDVLLYVHFDKMDGDKNITKERFKYFSKSPAQEVDAIYKAIDDSWRVFGLGVSMSSARPMDFRVLNYFDLITDRANGVAEEIFSRNGNVAKHNGKLITYEINRDDPPDDSPGSNMGFSTNASIERTIKVIEEGNKTNYERDVVAKRYTFQKFDIEETLSPSGVKELIQLKERIDAIRAKLPNKTAIAKMGVSDQMMRAADEALREVGFTDRTLRWYRSNEAHDRNAALLRAQRQPARHKIA